MGGEFLPPFTFNIIIIYKDINKFVISKKSNHNKEAQTLLKT